MVEWITGNKEILIGIGGGIFLLVLPWLNKLVKGSKPTWDDNLLAYAVKFIKGKKS